MPAGVAAVARHDREPTPAERAIERARHVLPDQGPMGVCLHQNTLHASRHRPLHEGVPAGAALPGARP